MSKLETAKTAAFEIQKDCRRTMCGAYVFTFQGKHYRVTKDADRPSHSRWLCEEHDTEKAALMGARVYGNYSHGRTRSEAIQTIICSKLED